MIYRIKVLAYSKDDYCEIRAYVRKKFGNKVWLNTDADIKKIFKQIADLPLVGSVPEEIEVIGLTHFRQRLVGQTRVIYQIKEDEIFIHMFVDTNRDFQTVLYSRLMSK